MREIKFRGKRIDNGEWVFGWIYGDKVKAIITLIKNIQMNEVETFDTSRVIPETVGQYTGLKDRDGVEIYEGDVVHCVSKMDKAYMIVIFEHGEFHMINRNSYRGYKEMFGYYHIGNFEKEVIGNIHDNPELMEGEE